MSLLDLPDLVLRKICCYVAANGPLDLLSLESTCHRFRYLVNDDTNSWHVCTTRTFEGIWLWLDLSDVVEKQRQTGKICSMKELIRSVIITNNAFKLSTRTKLSVSFDSVNNAKEKWQRCDSPQFRLAVWILATLYTDVNKQASMHVLDRKWVYDIGIYRRIEATFRFDDPLLEPEVYSVLAEVSQARDRDLQTRRHANKSPSSYVKRVAIANRDTWQHSMFPSSLSGSICPLLLCPITQKVTCGRLEMSKHYGVAICIMQVIMNTVFLKQRWNKAIDTVTIITKAQKVCHQVLQLLESYEGAMQRFGGRRLVLQKVVAYRGLVPTEEEQQVDFLQQLSEVVRPLYDGFKAIALQDELGLSWEDVLQQVLVEYEDFDTFLDNRRHYWREQLRREIETCLFRDDDAGTSRVVGLNLTDCEMIGGCNQRQEMAASAYITLHGVAVVWQLVGQGRF